jgi:hypothetical protein
MPGLVPGIHVLLAIVSKTCMAGTGPAMTMLYTAVALLRWSRITK